MEQLFLTQIVQPLGQDSLLGDARNIKRGGIGGSRHVVVFPSLKQFAMMGHKQAQVLDKAYKKGASCIYWCQKNTANHYTLQL
jgi:hypothetical protein